jgi:hypothetical protein
MRTAIRKKALVTAALAALCLSQAASAQEPILAQTIDLGGNCGAGFPSLNSTPPVLTSDLTMFVTTSFPNSPITLFVQPPLAAPIDLGSDCLAYVDGVGAAVFSGLTDANGAFTVTVPVLSLVPFQPGIRCDAQAIVESTAPGSVNVLGVQAVVTNAIALIMGFDPPGPDSDVPQSPCLPCTKTRSQMCSCSGWSVVNSNFNAKFPNGLKVGVFNPSNGACPGNGKKFTATYSGRCALHNYLCGSSCFSGDFNCDTTNSSSSSGGGNLGRNAAALTINLVFNDTGVYGDVCFGDLVYVKPGDSLNGFTVRQILDAANQALGGFGFPTGYCPSDLNTLVAKLNSSFKNCAQSDWAGQRLFLQRPPVVTLN